MKKLILPLLIAALAMPMAVLACPGGKQMGQGMGAGKHGGHFAQMDANGDGTITAEEHAAGAAKRFAMMDANGNGEITVDEMKSRWQEYQKNCPLKEECPVGKDCPRNKGA